MCGYDMGHIEDGYLVMACCPACGSRMFSLRWRLEDDDIPDMGPAG